jgi:hypothetical protein
MGLTNWLVSRPRPNEILDYVIIQNPHERLEARIALSRKETEDLHDGEKEKRIRDAIAKAEKW